MILNIGEIRSRLRTQLHLLARDGSAIIELALTAPIFIILILGAAEFGRLGYAAIEVSNAARAGVGYGAQNHITASDIAGMKSAAIEDGSNVTPITAYAGPCVCPPSAATTSVMACTSNFIAGAGAINNPFSSCPTTSTTTEFVQVNTQAVVSAVIHLPGLPTTYTVHGSATLVVEQ